ncbi:uncharacterized protein LOC116614596 [Nematostella vectensis]|uniref:uncharacterized protein LOC116614596 n=1 Tax=Nematostella vectensis TaxID=45351 RepID=UPI00207750A2|nr:uncharacterized protein LOC116614596 [Nematostella vectensis]
MWRAFVYCALLLVSAAASLEHEHCEWKQSGLFKLRHRDSVLVDHVIASHNVTNPTHCSMNCLSNERCASFNFKKQDQQSYMCELNNKSAAEAPGSLVNMTDWNYYDASIGCCSNPCVGNATCESGDGPDEYRCTCKDGYVDNGTTCIAEASYSYLGCFKDTGDRAIALPFIHPSTLQECFEEAKRRGNIVFAMQARNYCFTSPDAHHTYNKYGPAPGCSGGNGGQWANDVYRINY